MKNYFTLILTLICFSSYGQTTLSSYFSPRYDKNKTIIDYNITNDTLKITFEYYTYDFGSPHITCAVMNCTDDHRTYFRERYYFYIKPGEERFLYKEIGSEQVVEKTTTSKEWLFYKQ